MARRTRRLRETKAAHGGHGAFIRPRLRNVSPRRGGLRCERFVRELRGSYSGQQCGIIRGYPLLSRRRGAISWRRSTRVYAHPRKERQPESIAWGIRGSSDFPACALMWCAYAVLAITLSPKYAAHYADPRWASRRLWGPSPWPGGVVHRN